MSDHRKWGSDTDKNSSPGTTEERLSRVEHRCSQDDQRWEEAQRAIADLRREVAWTRGIALSVLVIIAVIFAVAGVAALNMR